MKIIKEYYQEHKFLDEWFESVWVSYLQENQYVNCQEKPDIIKVFEIIAFLIFKLGFTFEEARNLKIVNESKSKNTFCISDTKNPWIIIEEKSISKLNEKGLRNFIIDNSLKGVEKDIFEQFILVLRKITDHLYDYKFHFKNLDKYSFPKEKKIFSISERLEIVEKKSEILLSTLSKFTDKRKVKNFRIFFLMLLKLDINWYELKFMNFDKFSFLNFENNNENLFFIESLNKKILTYIDNETINEIKLLNENKCGNEIINQISIKDAINFFGDKEFKEIENELSWFHENNISFENLLFFLNLIAKKNVPEGLRKTLWDSKNQDSLNDQFNFFLYDSKFFIEFIED